MSDILQKIVTVKHEEIAAAQRKKPLDVVRFDAESRVLTRDFEGALRVETPEASRQMLMGVLEGRDDPTFKAASEIVALNAGVALYAANVATNMGDGIALARRTLASGAALAKLEQLKAFAA